MVDPSFYTDSRAVAPVLARLEADRAAAERVYSASKPSADPPTAALPWWDDPAQLTALQTWLALYGSASATGALAAVSKSWGRAVTQAEADAPAMTVDQGRGTEVLTAARVAFVEAVASPEVVSRAGTVADAASPVAASLRTQLGESPDEFAGTIVRVENANELSATVR